MFVRRGAPRPFARGEDRGGGSASATCARSRLLECLPPSVRRLRSSASRRPGVVRVAGAPTGGLGLYPRGAPPSCLLPLPPAWSLPSCCVPSQCDPPGGRHNATPPPLAISSQPRAPRLRACSRMRNTTHSSGMAGRGAPPPGEQKPGSSVAPPPYSGRARSLDGSPYPCASRRPATRPSGTRPRLGS